MKIPIVVIIFNRPDKTKKLYESLRIYKPDTLLIISDGSRKNSKNDKERVRQSREIFKHIDWNCEVLFNESKTNLGCRERIISGLNWVFYKVEKAIILEDDCIPSKEFFSFMEEMLERYQSNIKIGSICGTNQSSTKAKVNESYFFSKYQSCWGWGTWRDRWQKLDSNLDNLDKIKKRKFLKSYLGSFRAYFYWHWILNKVKNRKIDSWAYIWTFTGFINEYLHAIPKKSLVENIGFDDLATHTKKLKYNIKIANNSNFKFPIIHPSKILVNNFHDQYVEDKIYSKSLKNRLFWFLKS